MPKRYHTIFNLVALSIVIYFGVDLFYSVVRSRLRRVERKTIVVEPVSQAAAYQKPPLRDYQSIMERNFFGSVDKPADKEPEKPVVDVEALEPTSLKITLLGTASGSPRNAYAVIEETTRRKQGLFKIGDTIQQAVITDIQRNKVVLKVGDKYEILTMEETPGQSPGKGGAPARAGSRTASRSRRMPSRSSPRSAGGQSNIAVDRAEVEESLTNINKLLSEVRIRPHFRDGKPDGLSLSKVKEGSLFAKLGLQDGDVVQAVNDKNIKSPDDVLTLYKRLRSGSEVAIQINRKGQSKTLNYTFK
jgi:general secretion pathway protein C